MHSLFPFYRDIAIIALIEMWATKLRIAYPILGSGGAIDQFYSHFARSN
jgi:hypothetical protein